MSYEDTGPGPARLRFLSELGIAPHRVFGLTLAHSRRVHFPLEDGHAPPSEGADGLILRDPAYAVSVTVADCMPIWLLDRSSGAFGVLHSGWKGTGILETALEALRLRYGTRPSEVAAIFGPAIGVCCYAVPDERALSFAALFGAAAAPRRGGQAYLDLRAANLALAQRLGLGAVLSVELCTVCTSELGSYRREAVREGAREDVANFTRMLALAAVLP